MELVEWVNECSKIANLKIEKVRLTELDQWSYDIDSIEHKTKGFFSIIGLSAINKVTGLASFSQPIINQPEIGLLGFILANSKDGIQILLQAKTEPGNIGGTHVGPTVQATQSNYMRKHMGKSTKFLEFFIENDKLKYEGTLQSEQGTRFLSKYNRNVTVFVEFDEVGVQNGNWKWFSLDSVLSALDKDYLINTDARSVLVCANWDDLNAGKKAFSKNRGKKNFGKDLFNSLEFIDSPSQLKLVQIAKLLEIKRKNSKFQAEIISLDQLSEYTTNDFEIVKKNVLSVVGLRVSVNGREVGNWDQPLIESLSDGEVILYCKKIEDVLHFLVGFSFEIGFKESFQFGPSVMNLDNECFQGINVEASKVSTILSYAQSDEGGRFYHSTVHYYLKEISADEEVELTDAHIRMTLGQIKCLLKEQGNFTNEFRSVLSLILKYL